MRGLPAGVPGRPTVLLAVVVALHALAAVPAAADEVLVSAHLEPQEVRPGDDVFLTIEATGGVFDQVGFTADFQLLNLERVGQPAMSRGISWNNGVASRSHRKTWRLRAQSFGTAAVRDLHIEINGRRMELPGEQVRVVSDPATPRRRPSGRLSRPSDRLSSPLQDWLRGRQNPRRETPRPKVMLIAEAVPANPWAGQQVTYNLWLYTQTSIGSVSLKKMPEFRGFWVEEVEQRQNLTSERVERDGELFHRSLLTQRVLFPIRPGRYELEPAELYAMARMTRTDPFAARLAPAEKLVLTSQPVTLDVKPLPPVPADLEAAWSGLVGDFSIAARLLPSELAVGEASTLELTLTGNGHAEGLEMPRPELPDEVQAMPAEASGGNRLRGDRVQAERTWAVPLVPHSPGTWRLPPVELAYFDPGTSAYRLARSEPLVLRARRGEIRAAAAGASLIHPLKNAALPTDGTAARDWHRSLPWLFGLPWALVLVTGLVGVLRRPEAGAASQADAFARFHARLAAAGDEERPRQAALGLEAAWRELLAEVYGVGAGDPAASWPLHLREVGVPPRRTAELEELLEEVHYLRHAPQLSTVSELAGDLRHRSLRLARRLAP